MHIQYTDEGLMRVDPADGDEKNLTVDDLTQWLLYGFEGSQEPLVVYLIRLGRLDLVKWLVSQDKPLMSKNYSGLFVPGHAARHGQLHILQWFFGDAGFLRVEGSEDCVRKSLFAAAYHNHLQVMQWLLRPEGGECAFKCELQHRHTALDIATRRGNLEIVKWLFLEQELCLSDNSTAMLFHSAVEYNHIAVVKWFIGDCKVSVSEQDYRGFTAVLHSAESGHLNLLHWLLSDEGGGSATDKATVAGGAQYTVWSFMINNYYKWLRKYSRPEITACLKQLLLLSAPPQEKFVRYPTPWIVELVRNAAYARPALAEWREARAVTVAYELVFAKLPSALAKLVEGYAVPSLDETFDQATVYGQWRGAVANRTRASRKRRREHAG